MSNLDRLPERALDLASQAGDKLRDFAPRATDWLDAGAKLGALKAASKIALKVVRRNPVVFTATLAGAGLLWYAARRRAARAEKGNGAVLEGSARRVEARDGDKDGRRTRAKRATTGTKRASTRTRRVAATTEPRTEH